jgi:protein-S-isoprenylcysteine O-methyltransferase Ste14
MILPTTAAAIIWGVWLLGWLLSASITGKTVRQESGTSQLAYSIFIWVGAILLFFHPTTLGSLNRPLLTSMGWLSWSGVALVLIGLGFAGWARFHLGRLWSGRVTLKENHTIVRTGPYGMVRHPIYTGLVIALVGTALSQITVVALFGMVLLIVGLLLKIGQEERLLTGHFGGAYDVYRREVRGLIPYIW